MPFDDVKVFFRARCASTERLCDWRLLLLVSYAVAVTKCEILTLVEPNSESRTVFRYFILIVGRVRLN